MKKVLITGITGQDGSYLAEFLLEKGYEVYGTTRESSVDSFWRIKGFSDRIVIHQGNVKDEVFLRKTIKKTMPDEIYHLASLVDAGLDFAKEQDIFWTNFLGPYYILRIIKEIKSACRIFFAGSSLVFGEVDSFPQNENTPMRPNTPYGIAKAAAYHFAKMYRETYDMFVCTGILFNHESPRRDLMFLPRKITNAAAQIKYGIKKELVLGDINAERDWGFAGDYIEAMWLMLQKDVPEDYIIGTGELHSVKEILNIAFGYVGLAWEKFVKFDERFTRKVDPKNLLADSTKAAEELGWVPKVKFKELIEMMVKNDLQILKDNYDKTY